MAIQNFFNFDAAMSVAETQCDKDFLLAQRARFEAMTPDLINEVLAAFAAGNNRKALTAFYAQGDWAVLEAGSILDVANAADFAQKAADARLQFNLFGAWVARLVLTLLVAGFLG